MKKYLTAVIVVFIIVGGVLWVSAGSSTPSKPTATHKTNGNQTPKPQVAGFDKTQYSNSDPASVWVVVNKQHPLIPKTYVPNDLVTPHVPLRVPGNESMQLRAATATAVEALFFAAKSENLSLMVSSGYRSYTYQVGLYGGYVSAMGATKADTQSARPGFSEHQTGLALDIEPASKTCELEQCFGATPEGKWLALHAYEYGFILRYTPSDVATTGYESEPWHYRYVGVALATQIHNSSVATLESFFGVPGGSSYTN